MFDAIQTAEARLILKSHGVTIPVVPNTQLNAVLRERFLKLEPRDAHDGMVQFLRKTQNLLPLSALVDQLPQSCKQRHYLCRFASLITRDSLRR